MFVDALKGVCVTPKQDKLYFLARVSSVKAATLLHLLGWFVFDVSLLPLTTFLFLSLSVSPTPIITVIGIG